MQYFKNLLTTISSISRSIDEHNKILSEILKKQEEKIEDLSIHVGKCITINTAWGGIISSNLVEDSRDEGVMIDRNKAIKIVTINGKAEKTETFTRLSSLTKEEKEHHKKYGIVLIIIK